MDIDIERLKTDAAYWDELAIPEKANWAAIKNGSFVGWAEYSMGNESILNLEMIPRPTKPAAPEWVDGLPPVGCECESATRGSGYRVGHITYVSDQVLVWMDKLSGYEYATRPHDREFRPIRTAEQRQRDELAVEIWSLDGRSKDHAYSVADHILSRYNLEPKDA